jgi:hypothetical protein
MSGEKPAMKQRFSKEAKERHAIASGTASSLCGYSEWHGNSPFAQSRFPPPVQVHFLIWSLPGA